MDLILDDMDKNIGIEHNELYSSMRELFREDTISIVSTFFQTIHLK